MDPITLLTILDYFVAGILIELLVRYDEAKNGQPHPTRLNTVLSIVLWPAIIIVAIFVIYQSLKQKYSRR